jgi:hypothetical protein
MSAWGKADSKTASGTLSIASDGVVTGSSTELTTQAAVGDFIRASIAGAGADEERSWIIKSITSNTVAAVIPADPELEYTTAYANFGTFGAQTYQLSEKPTSIASDPNTQASQVYGVDTNEMVANKTEEGAAHTGWNKVTTKTVGGVARKQVETLVAMSKNGITSDAEDVVFEDFLISIATQPVSDSSATGEAVTFSVVAAITGSGGTLTYQWQEDSGSGFANITEAGVYSDVDTDTLAISDNTGLDTYQYRVVVSATGADSVNSAAATLTEA